jgi:hypothetical protein
MVRWLKRACLVLCCLSGGEALAWSCVTPAEAVFDTQKEQMVLVGPFVWTGAPNPHALPELSPDRYSLMTPAQSAQYYHAGPFAKLRDTLKDGEILFMGRFSLIRAQDKARFHDIDKMYGMLGDWYDRENAPLVGTSTHSFHNVLKFEGHVLDGETWIPFSSQNITYQVAFRDSAYGPFFTMDGRPPLDLFEFGKFSLKALSQQALSRPTSTYLVTGGSRYHHICPPGIRIRFENEQDWEDAFKACAVPRSHARPEACWRQTEFGRLP